MRRVRTPCTTSCRCWLEPCGHVHNRVLCMSKRAVGPSCPELLPIMFSQGLSPSLARRLSNGSGLLSDMLH